MLVFGRMDGIAHLGGAILRRAALSNSTQWRSREGGRVPVTSTCLSTSAQRRLSGNGGGLTKPLLPAPYAPAFLDHVPRPFALCERASLLRSVLLSSSLTQLCRKHESGRREM
jgi:hypothetical protein